MFKAIAYLNSNRASEMLDFYEKNFDAVVISKVMANDTMFANSSEDMKMPEEIAKDFVMNAEFEILEQTFMLSDTWEKQEINNQGANICFTFDGNNEAEIEQAKAFYNSALESGCKIIMPLGPTEWTKMYAMWDDPFGVTWMISANQK